jgi:hypothetical protein
VSVDVLRVLHHHKFDPQEAGLEHLRYLLFGGGTELYLAHRITHSPDSSPAFDQLLTVALPGTTIMPEMLRRTVEITIPGR